MIFACCILFGMFRRIFDQSAIVSVAFHCHAGYEVKSLNVRQQ